ncbi:glucose-1-phosphate adenylyltransferase [Proteiniclasticum sp. SCR006]|uniref:Glucose-1-phosphate adenylyltransferase n=1 Tax=Proteiniclasticum aestuarii TaxID=2817862 RepID=A0A939KGQ6_9CLOT|nr:glucose-1-phosphate adenylyltransferase [Proteiniclasticum aestuarii]MBO1265782.1 glucose-1-phosphate adenylyltransferase [Proteiniclasticum aestuarii]
MKTEIIAMILAGGQGTRLGKFTKNIAKPAVPFGGKYRIIDFVLSNCANSNMNTVGVLTQYQPLILNTHIGIGSPWDMDRNDGGVTILQPYASATEEKWFRGTAHAIYQNFSYIEDYDPDFILVLSGDHIYKMNYESMLDFHKEKEAALTIAVLEVPWEEAPRFGIMNADEELRIKEFEEKPEKPKSNLASMGIYIFNWKLLKKYMNENINAGKNMDDFGKNVIPEFLNANERVYAYPFQGYWKDVGTLDSLWEANMDLLDQNSELQINDRSWKIYSKNPSMPPQYLSKTADVRDSLIVEGCIVHGKIRKSILSPKVIVGEGTEIYDSVIMEDVKIGKNCIIRKAMIGSHSVIPDNSTIDENGEIAVVGEFEIFKEAK